MNVPEHLDVEHYRAHVRKAKSDNTARTYVGGVHRFLEWVAEERIDVPSARRAFLDDFVAWLQDRNLSHATVRVTCVAAWSYLQWLKRNDMPLPEFMKPELPKKPQKQEPRVLSETAVQCYLEDADALEEPMRTLCLLLFATGARSFELCQLRLTDVSVVDVDGVGRIVLSLHGKGDKLRTIPLPIEYIPIFRDYLATWLAAHYEKHRSPWVFPRNKSQCVSERALRDTMQKLRQELGFSDLSPHILRKTYSTFLSTNGMPPFMIAQLIGHVTDQTLAFRVTSEHYVHHALTALVQRLDQIVFPTPPER